MIIIKQLFQRTHTVLHTDLSEKIPIVLLALRLSITKFVKKILNSDNGVKKFNLSCLILRQNYIDVKPQQYGLRKNFYNSETIFYTSTNTINML